MKDDMINKLHNDLTLERNNSDGIYQLFLGLVMFVFGLLGLFDRSDNSIMFLLLFMIMIPIIVTRLRKWITYPRIGYAKIKDITPTWISILRFILILLFLGIISYFELTNTEPIPNNSSKLFFPVMLTIYTVSFVAWFIMYLRKKRPNLVYFLTFLVTGVAWLLWYSPEKWQIKISFETVLQIMLVLGLVNLIFGIKTLIAFIRQYPVLTDEER